MSRPRIAVSTLFAAALTLILAVGSAGTAPPGGAAGQHAFVPGELLVKFNPSAKGLDKASARAQLNAAKVKGFRSGAEHWKLGPGHAVDKAIERLKKNPHVAYAEPNYVITADVIPNDPRLNELYGMINTGQTGGTNDADIDADLAWSVSTGSSDVIVGVIDTGCDYNHPDLAGNIWTNPGEIAGNASDDDNNGFVDDIHGWDFYNNDSDPFDDNGHGTHVSGTIGGVGNNGTGVVGVNWDVTIMCLKFLSGGGSGSTAGAIAAVDYSVLMGVDLTSNSWGGGGFSQALMDAIADANAAEQAFIAAAGNDGTNNDATPHYPSNYDLPNVISVAATDHNDAKASFSNYGAVTVDLGAPGVNILSTLPGNSYGSLSGTSMATPHVAGAAALIRSVSPGIPVAQLKTVLLNSVDHIASMNGITTSGGRLNAFFSIATPDSDAPGAVSDLAAINPGSNTMGLTWTAPGDDGFTGTATYYQVRYSTSPIDDMNFGAATRAGNEPNPLPAGSMQSMEVRGLDADTYYYFAVVAFDEWGNGAPVSNLATESTLRPPTAAVSPGSHTLNLFTGQSAELTSVLANVGVGTLDFTISAPSLGEPMSVYEPLELDKDVQDPRPGILGTGGPDGFGYRWTDSDQAGGPLFSWTDISGTGTPVAITTDDSTSAPIALGFNMPFYGGFFNSIRVCTNGWLSFTSASTAYANQPLPNSGAPENLIAPFWDDLNPAGATLVYYQTFANKAIVQWTGMPKYQEAGSAMTFQAILDEGGAITFQYLTLTGTQNDATVGIQDAAKTTGLTVAYNQTYLHDNLAVRIVTLPQWLTVSPISGRLYENDEVDLMLHVDASGLEGGTYPGTVNIETNDPTQPILPVTVSLHITGAPDASVQPGSLDFGDAFLGLPETMTLIVANVGTDTLMVSSIDSSHPGELTATPSSFNVPPHGSQAVTVNWTPALLGPFSGTLTVMSNDAGEAAIPVAVTGNGIPAPVMIVDPNSLSETLFSGSTSTQTLSVTNAGGSDLVLTAAANQGTGGNALVFDDPAILGQGGPDGFGYRWRDSDAPGGPAFNFIDISATGTQIFGTGIDDSLSAAINMGMTFPFYGNNYTSLKVSSNGWLTFDTAQTLNRNSNATIPSTSGAPKMVAFYWDDLHTGTTGNVKYKLDGNKFIIQYTNVRRFSPSTGHNFTFQVQLHNDGKVLIMFQTMSGTVLSSATIGQQDVNVASTTNALLVVFQNSSTPGVPPAYVHNNMAVQISRVPDWLRVSPASATVAPNDTASFTVTFDATGRPGGDLTGSIVFGTNIPSQPTVSVPASLHIIGAPLAAVSPTSIAYGTVFAGYPQLRTFQVLNNGTDVLNVSDIDTTDPYLTVEEGQGNGALAAFDLAPGSARLFNLRWNPPVGVASSLGANVRVYSDDPVNPILMLPATGTAIVPPEAVVTPTSITDSMNSGEVRNHVVTVENRGSSPLTFSTATRALGTTPVFVHDELKLDKDEIDPRPGLLGSGGPDLFGYRWKDSDAPGGPTFSWTDISAIGTPITTLTTDDQNSGPITIGFSFPFYGTSFSSVRVTTNGWLSFTSTATSFSNQPLPNSGTGAPENLIAAFWDDLDFRGAQHAYYYNDGTRFIVQWDHVDHHSSVGSADLTFQAILHPNGRILLQYHTMTGLTNSATIGLQNSTKNDGQTVVFQSSTTPGVPPPYVHDNMAVQISPPLDFLQVSPSSGTINPGDPPVLLDVRIDSANLLGGDYAAAIDVLTNDPANGLIPISVAFHVTGVPDIEATPALLVFPTTFLGYPVTLPAMIRNAGTEALQITGFGISGDFSVSGLTAPVTLPVGGSIPIVVTFAPTFAGGHIGELAVSSDDPDEPSVSIGLSGDALVPPEIGVAPASISTALPPGGSRTKTVTICNDGGSDLDWTSGTSIISALGNEVMIYDELLLGRDEVDPRPGILGSGGPDTFGYQWTDSDDPAGPAFGWVDISSVGTPITFNATGYCVDCTSGPFPIGFSFPYYGSAFSTVRVTTEGWISFTNTSTAYSNQPLPNSGSGVPENLLAAFWDDLVLRNGTGSEPDNRPSHAYYYFDGTRFIVQWDHFYRIADYDDDLNFQIILYPSGRIVYQYLTMSTQTLNSATIGQQNATKTDGLTILHNAAYMHDGLAIEIAATPEWLTMTPTVGTVAVGECQEVTATMNAAGLDDGIHEATIQIASNDPAMPLVQVPVTLNVGLVDATLVDIDPDVLNLAANGNTAKVVIELSSGLDPHAINFGDISVNGVRMPVVTPPAPSYSDADHDGLEEVTFKIDREALAAVLPEGDAVPVSVQGEVTDLQWWSALGTIRIIRPHVLTPLGGDVATEGGMLPIAWTAPVWSGSVQYDVHLSRDGGLTWENLASGLTTTNLDWVVSGAATSRARIMVVAQVASGSLGWDLNDGEFTITGPVIHPPMPIDPDSLEVLMEVQGMTIRWAAPGVDAMHGPADRYRILRADAAQGPFSEIAVQTQPEYTASTEPALGQAFFFEVVASNAAGDSN